VTIHPVILCGGPGSRLWPASTPSFPKPFLSLIGGTSLFQRTVTRMAALDGAAPPMVVTGLAHLDLVRRQMREVGVTGAILAEPEGRDSAPAIIAACLAIAADDPRGLAMVVASDHHIPEESEFAAGVAEARGAAEAGRIVTFGVRPAGPSAAYGYIRPGIPIAADSRVLDVAAFLEKPDAVRARALIADGCLWNSGNFLFRVDTMLAEAEALCPALISGARKALDGSWGVEGALVLGTGFGECPKVSIDVCVMEKTSRAAVIPVSYAWSDLGAWDAIWAASPHDADGNAKSGRSAARDSRDCLLRAEPGIELVAVGLERLAVIASAGRVLVCDLGQAPMVKDAVSALPRETATSGAADPEAAFSEARRTLVQWLWNEALPRWWCFGADHAAGGFHESLRWDLSPTGHPRRLRVQARQVFVYATAGRMGWSGPWRTAVRHGLDWIEARHRREDGLYRTRVGADGSREDDSAHLYDQAFVLLALAAAARAIPEMRAPLSAQARDLARRVNAVFALPGGGFRAFETVHAFEADPIMHLFEAAQAWLEVEETPVWTELSETLAAHFLDRMVDTDRHAVREVFDADWRPLDDLAGRVIEPGHQFEWAWLLERWGRRRGDGRARAAAAGLYATGRRGVEAGTGLALDELREDLTRTGSACRLWPQAERLRAALLLESGERSRLEAAVSAAKALGSYFTTEPRGLWRDSRFDLAAEEEAALASSLYHIVGAIQALDAHGREAVGNATEGAPGKKETRRFSRAMS
jgi:mannose-1-phosphate guanylyltransferase/mannose-6-phosphate isomerase